MTTHAKARPILHADWPIRLGENRPDRALKHLVAMLVCIYMCLDRILLEAYLGLRHQDSLLPCPLSAVLIAAMI